jgi:hypothetical protein
MVTDDGAQPDPDDTATGDAPVAGARHRRTSREPGIGRSVVLIGAVVVALVVLAGVAYTLMGSPYGSAFPAGPAQEAPQAEPSASDPEAAGAATARAHKTGSASASATPTPTPTPDRSPTASPHVRARPAVTANPARTRVVQATYVLNPGEAISGDGVSLVLGTDGNLALRDSHGQVTWSSGTHAQGTQAVFQADGNFVVYRGGQSLWTSHTEGHSGAVLTLHTGGSMTIDQNGTALWTVG